MIAQQHVPAALYPRERPGTHCRGCWVAPGPVRAGGKSHPHRDSIADSPAPSQSLYRLSYPVHTTTNNNNNNNNNISNDINNNYSSGTPMISQNTSQQISHDRQTERQTDRVLLLECLTFHVPDYVMNCIQITYVSIRTKLCYLNSFCK